MKLLIAKSAVELVPDMLANHPQVRATKGGILDSAYHHKAMRSLEAFEERGRPDIVHFCLLDALESPLAIAGRLEVHLHTREGHWLSFEKATRLPRNQERFKGIMAKMLRERKDQEFVKYRGNATLDEMRRRLGGPSILLSQMGVKTTYAEITSKISDDALIVIGGFPYGDFSDDEKNGFDSVYSVSAETLNAWTVVSRTLAAIESKMI